MDRPSLIRVAPPAGVDECRVVGLFSHDDPTRTELGKLFSEVRYDPGLASELAEQLIEAIAGNLPWPAGRLHRVVPLPSTRSLPLVLATTLAGELDLPEPRGDDLRWNRTIGPMKDVPIADRPTYAVGAMSARPMPGEAVLLVDDATRSGATFAEAARAVRAAGADRVVCIALVAIDR